MVDTTTIQKTKVDYARVLIQLHNPKILQLTITIKTPVDTHHPPCHKCNRWGHKSEDCDPDHARNREIQRKNEKIVKAKATLNHQSHEAKVPSQDQRKKPSDPAPKAQLHMTKWQVKDKGKMEEPSASTMIQHIINNSPSRYFTLEELQETERLDILDPFLILY